MSVVKGLLTALLGILLFISLIGFGTGLMLNATMLNADWVSKQVQKLDVSEVAREAVDNSDINLPAEAEAYQETIYNVIYDLVDEYEPWLKEQADNVINSGYAYLKGESDYLSITVDLTDVKADLKESLWIAVEDNAGDLVMDFIGDDLTAFAGDNIDSFIGAIPADMLPPEVAGLSDAQIQAYIDANLDTYLSGINVEALIESVMPEIEMQLDTTVRPYFDQSYDEFMQDVPDVYVLNEDEIPADVMEGLQAGREYLGYFQTVFYVLIGVIVVLSLLIFAVHRNLKGTFLALGCIFGLYGLLQTASLIIARSINPLDYVPDIPMPALESWVQSVYADMYTGPFMIFSIGLLAVGVAMIVVALVVKRNSPVVED